jgi:threonine synthase
VRYDLKKVKRTFRKKALVSRRENLWRYWEMLPVNKEENIVSLGEGMTPLIRLKHSGPKLGVNHLYLKDEGLIPTGTFKARGAAVGVSRAKELGVKVLAMPTNGNAGGSWAAYCAKAGIKAIIVMPQDAPMINRKEVAITGAELYLVNGLISDAGKIVGRAIAEYGWYDASTLKEPYRIEGKKTMGLEIAEQLGWEVPDAIIYPTGGGVGIIGIYKGLKELQEISWIDEKMPSSCRFSQQGARPLLRPGKRKSLSPPSGRILTRSPLVLMSQRHWVIFLSFRQSMKQMGALWQWEMMRFSELNRCWRVTKEFFAAPRGQRR